MNFQKEQTLNGDKPQRSLASDQFGLDKITESICATLQSRISANGYAIGIEAEWGAGKSSFVHFIAELLAKDTLSHKVIWFEPWLIGSKDALLSSLFGQLVAAIRDFGADARVRDKLASNPDLIERITSRMALYASVLEKGSVIIDYAATVDPTGKSKIAAAGLRLLSSIAKWCSPKNKSLEKLKEEINGDLQILSNLLNGLRFTVIVDDLDRLDPHESVEILRLIKAVADFPILTYLVCFDRKVLASHVETVLHIPEGDGHSYIEKIFQAFVPLPPQEPFALRRFSRKLLAAAFPNEMISAPSEGRERLEREQTLFDVWIGPFVETPRDAIRLAEAVKLGWPYINEKADFVDFVWLQLVKLQCHQLHDWVRNYVVTIGSYRDAGRPSDHEPESEARELREILNGIGWATDRDRVGLRSILPGLRKYTDPAKPRVFDLEKGELELFERGRRLGSPSHWRYYFSFDAPSYALEDDLLSRYLKAVSASPAEAVALLRQIKSKVHDNKPGYFFEVFLERLFDRKSDLTESEQVGIAKTFSEMLDEVEYSAGNFFGSAGIWDRAGSLLAPSVSPHWKGIVETAPSINWLSDVMRIRGSPWDFPIHNVHGPIDNGLLSKTSMFH